MISNAVLFLLGFTSVVSVYEVAKTDKKVKTDTVTRRIERIGKIFK